jgi:hypothetical protein
MSGSVDKFVCTGEDAIAFWACCFPNNVEPDRVIRSMYSGVLTEILVFAPTPHLFGSFSLSSIEQRVTHEYAHQHWGKDAPKRSGSETLKVYRLSWYTHDCSEIVNKMSLIHAALIFSRFFFRPTKKEYVEVHASRLQHLFGVANLSMKKARSLAFSRDSFGFNFCEILIQFKALGIDTIPVNFLRAWVTGALSRDHVHDHMTSGNEAVMRTQCCFCLIPATTYFVSRVKVGAYWHDVIININSEGLHLTYDKVLKVERDYGQLIIMGLYHMIQYEINDDADSQPLTYGRCLAWGHKVLRNEVIGADLDDRENAELTKQLLLASLRCHNWSQEGEAPLYKLLLLCAHGADSLSADKHALARSMSAFSEHIEDSSEYGSDNARQLAHLRATYNV